MKNIFSQTKDYVKPPKRNVFDLSFQNNLTMNFGTLYPVFCKEVIPGDSFSIDSTFALRFLPMAFPVQTKMTANLHFFYVRNRNLWDGWQKFIGHTDSSRIPPYIDFLKTHVTTGSLADYLGIPTTRVGVFGNSYSVDINDLFIGESNSAFTANLFTYGGVIDFSRNETSDNFVGLNAISIYNRQNVLFDRIVIKGNQQSGTDFRLFFAFVKSDNSVQCFSAYQYDLENTNEVNLNIAFSKLKYSYDFGLFSNSIFDTEEERLDFFESNHIEKVVIIGQNPRTFIPLTLSPPNPNRKVDSVSFVIDSESVTDLLDVPSTNNPFVLNNPNHVTLSALPFRAYESIYNAFYRNEQNDPLMINGKPEYDKYVPNTSDGVDSYPYKLYQRNWELDFLTSAVQSPQQGIAPLVGVSSAGDFTFVHKDSNGNIGYFGAKANLSSDGETISSVQLSDKVEINGLPTTPITADIPDDVKRGSIYSLKQMALAGISINDFRNVNSLQRWLETNIRRGFKYRDQIKSHFGVDIDFKTLDMPEFIGGVSEPVYVNQVNQTTETETDPLGSYAGQASLLASSNHTIRHYCDEHGFIIGIMSIVPVPNYSQLLPKHFIKNNYLDYFFPEFGHIGMQPIDYREVCPIQQFSSNPQGILDTFGYQRAWYDYIASVDEVHGLFRTNLRNFVLNRQFDTLPKLNKDFLQIDNNQLNDIFTVQEVSDKILGQIKFNVIAKRPIPRFGIPRLE